MKYFEGIQWGGVNHIPKCDVFKDRLPKDYCSLNFAAAGRVRFQFAGGSEQILHAPVTWWEPLCKNPYAFVPVDGETWDHYFITLTGPRIQSGYRCGLISKSKLIIPLTAKDGFREAYEKLFKMIALKTL
ncbi:MAG: hypothetical protein SGI71_00060 [Verrucomicrobiota bacterium]|nr:hypothetical protein [Verrucomicrobiota bacterium]